MSRLTYVSLVSQFGSGLISAMQTKAVYIQYLISRAYIYEALISASHPGAGHQPGFESVASVVSLLIQMLFTSPITL